MLHWVKRSNSRTVSEVIENASGASAAALLTKGAVFTADGQNLSFSWPPEKIEGMERAGAILMDAILSQKRIAIFGDYDADGVTSTAILFLLLQGYGIRPTIRLPKRMTEGYGLSEEVVWDLIVEGNTDLLITVDNGIAAAGAIAQAKKSGMDVIVLDHHLCPGNVPPADAVVDPHVLKGPCFEDYCGAGLAYKLAEYMFSIMPRAEYGWQRPGWTIHAEHLESRLCTLAAIGTIADAVPMHGDNRRIVSRGLAFMNEKSKEHITAGLTAILNAGRLSEKTIDEDTVAFYLAPILNAPGRIWDNGATFACSVLAADIDSESLRSHAQKLVEANNARKQMVQTSMEKIEKELPVPVSSPICTLDESIHEGIAGIIAGKLADKYGVPAFVLTMNEDKTFWKGSARTAGDINIIADMETVISHDEYTYGGHAGAAGVKVDAGKIDGFIALLKQVFGKYQAVTEDTTGYDLEIRADEAADLCAEIEKMAPFGEGWPRPVVRINECLLKGERQMGAERQHIKFDCIGGVNVLGFNQAQKYEKLGRPNAIDVVGRLEMNRNPVYGDSLQLVAEDFIKSQSV